MSRTRRQRILIGVLDTLKALRSAVGDLANFGLDPEGMLIVADAGALSGTLERHFPVSRNSGPGPHVLIRVNKLGTPAMLDPDSEQIPHFARWLESGLSCAQSQHLNWGRALLVVRVRTADEERVYSEAMLLHSADNVQLHDL